MAGAAAIVDHWAFIVISVWPLSVRAREKPRTPHPGSGKLRDFQSRKLVVPSDVPRAEMTLPGAITVQMLHLLQDVYPVIASHQPLAASHPEQRLKDAYSWVYRLVRTPPSWHPDLEEGRRQGTLLGTLAVGGPFAKLVERTQSNARHLMARVPPCYPVRGDLAQLGFLFTLPAGWPAPAHAIGYNGHAPLPATALGVPKRYRSRLVATHHRVAHGLQ